MKENIPFNKFVFYIKNSLKTYKVGSKGWFKQITIENEIFAEMEKISWADFKSLSRSEMKLVPAGYVYDWTIVTESYDLKNKVEELYSRYDLPMLSGKDYLRKFA